MSEQRTTDLLLAAEERDVVEQMVADGELCAVDGQSCDFETFREQYGADRDGNRYIWVEYVACRKCGEPNR